MKFIGIIPARYASTRFPAKPLALLGGKPVIQRVYEQVAGVLDEVWVATDDERIEAVVKDFGGQVVMTSVHHKSGTDRCYEAYCKVNSSCDVIVNIQGDEPFIHRSQLEAIKACFDDDATQIATLVKPFVPGDGFEALENVNSPKVVVNRQMACRTYLLQAHRPVCLPCRRLERNYRFTPVFSGTGRIAGTIAMAGKRIYDQSRNQ